MKKIVFVAVVLAFAAGPAMAQLMPDPATDPVQIGGPILGNSWSFNINVPGSWAPDLYAVRISPGYEAVDSFESPAIARSGWSMVLDGPLLASAQGPAGNSWIVTLNGIPGPPPLLEIDNAWFRGDTKVGETHWLFVNGSIYNQGGSWRHSTDWNPTRAEVEVVPVPGAVLLGMLGLSLAGVKLRKHS